MRYGSGLPVELEEEDDDQDGDQDNQGSDEEPPAQPIPPAILDEVNFERGRIKPNFSLDFAALGFLELGVKLRLDFRVNLFPEQCLFVHQSTLGRDYSKTASKANKPKLKRQILLLQWFPTVQSDDQGDRCTWPPKT
jgi:hypothetical protein